MKLPSNLLNVMAGGKHEALALRIKNEPSATLECISQSDSVWENADDTVFPFRDGYDWRITTPKPLRYRVALMRGIVTGPYTAIVDTTREHDSLASRIGFFKWLGDWQTVEVDHV